mmetsp:Transcript_48391/g.80282  ORF Transcript_48391/g.80282 Transcript_48391/m.80282 type:complete len:1153 (+) Transcript_48391:74-3532(+)
MSSYVTERQEELESLLGALANEIVKAEPADLVPFLIKQLHQRRQPGEQAKQNHVPQLEAVFDKAVSEACSREIPDPLRFIGEFFLDQAEAPTCSSGFRHPSSSSQELKLQADLTDEKRKADGLKTDFHALRLETEQLRVEKEQLMMQLKQGQERELKMKLKIEELEASLSKAASLPKAGVVGHAVTPASVVGHAVTSASVQEGVTEAASKLIYTDKGFTALSAKIGQGNGKEASVRLVKGSWLCKLGSNDILQCRQDLPEDAFYDGPLDGEGIFLVMISYRWLSRAHPDPDGFHMRTLRAILTGFGKRADVAEIAVMIDFCSLYQNTETSQRTPQQESLFREGLRMMNVLYGHQATVVWALSRTPQNAGIAPYDNSGWCTFERQVSSVLKDSAMLIDFGLVPSEKLDSDQAFDYWSEISKPPLSTSQRSPPLSTGGFDMLLSTKAFTNGNEDHEMVVRLYALFLKQGLYKAEQLAFRNFGWDDDDLEVFCEVLAECSSLRSLLLGQNTFGDKHMSLLTVSLPKSLTQLNLGGCTRLTDAGAAILAKGLPLSLCSLDVSDGLRHPPLSCPIQNAHTIKQVDIFRRFYAATDEATRVAVVKDAEDLLAGEEEEAKQAALSMKEMVISGLSGVEVKCPRRVFCSGSKQVKLHGLTFREIFGGDWLLSRNEPLVDGVPHYEKMMLKDHSFAHLYRVRNTLGGSRRWVISPSVGADAAAGICFAGSRDNCSKEDILPTMIKNWVLFNGEQWTGDKGFTFNLSTMDMDFGEVKPQFNRLPFPPTTDEEWVQRVKMEDLNSFGTDRPSKKSAEAAFKRGITIGHIRNFTEKYSCHDFPTWQVVRDIIKPLTALTRCRYSELTDVSAYVGPAYSFVTHCWSAKWGTLLAAITDGSANPQRRVWLDVFACRQWPGSSADCISQQVVQYCPSYFIVCEAVGLQTLLTNEQRFARRADMLEAKVRRKIAFMRSWCLDEAVAALEVEGMVIVMKCGVLKEGKFTNDLKEAEALGTLCDIEDADSTYPGDAARILHLMRQKPDGIPGVNAKISSMIQCCQMCIHAPEVQTAACGDASIDISGSGLAKLIPWSFAAAGGGYVTLLQKMLEHGALPENIQERSDWYALSSAAGAGQLACVKAFVEYVRANFTRSVEEELDLQDDHYH